MKKKFEFSWVILESFLVITSLFSGLAGGDMDLTRFQDLRFVFSSKKKKFVLCLAFK